MKTNLYKNLEVQFNKIFRHLKIGSFKTRERYAKAFKRFMVYLAYNYHLQNLSNIAPKHIFSYVEYLQSKDMSASTIKTELSAIRFFHDNMPYAKYILPTNKRVRFRKKNIWRSRQNMDRTGV